MVKRAKNVGIRKRSEITVTWKGPKRWALQEEQIKLSHTKGVVRKSSFPVPAGALWYIHSVIIDC